MSTTQEKPVTLADTPGARSNLDTVDEVRYRLVLSMSAEMNARIEELAHRAGVDQGQLINRAIGLYKRASDATREGKRVLIVDEERDHETEIVGF